MEMVQTPTNMPESLGNEEKEAEMKVENGGRWWNKVMDWKEAKSQILFALPLILMNAIYLFIPLISVMFAGHVPGDIYLPAANLASSWSNVTGFMFLPTIHVIFDTIFIMGHPKIVSLCFSIGVRLRIFDPLYTTIGGSLCGTGLGLSGSLETLCGQGFGAQLYGMLGLYLQSSCFISIFLSILITIFWIFTEPILILLHQDPKISEMAALYVKYLIPGLFPYGLIQCLLRFLQMQSVVIPLVICSVVPLVIHIGLTYILVHLTPLGYIGAPLASSITFWIAFFMLAVYVFHAKKCKETWQGFSLESLSYLLPNLKLALPSAFMYCLEYWATEVLVLLAGLLPNSKITTPLMAMLLNTEISAYMIAYGLSAAVCTRVSNELGAGNPDKAKHAFKVTLKLSVLLGLVTVLALGVGHNIWARLFSDNPVIITEFAAMVPFLVIGLLMDTVQGILTGVARGCGWQQVVVYINLGVYYCLMLPIAVFLAFKLKLHVKGLYIGLMCGIFSQTSSLLLLTYLKKWKRLDLPGNNNVENQVVV